MRYEKTGFIFDLLLAGRRGCALAGNFVYNAWFETTNGDFLFDMKNDPLEAENLIDRPEQLERMATCVAPSRSGGNLYGW